MYKAVWQRKKPSNGKTQGFCTINWHSYTARKHMTWNSIAQAGKNHHWTQQLKSVHKHPLFSHRAVVNTQPNKHKSKSWVLQLASYMTKSWTPWTKSTTKHPNKTQQPNRNKIEEKRATNKTSYDKHWSPNSQLAPSQTKALKRVSKSNCCEFLFTKASASVTDFHQQPWPPVEEQASWNASNCL